MARLAAFRGTTYDTDRVSPGDVVAPPYDVVGPAERDDLAARSPYNSILVELPLDPAGGDPYEHAESVWSGWHDESVVVVAEAPTFYVYRMTFAEEDGTVRSTTGVLGALGLDPQHTGEVLPHEQTTPKDKHDRLSLLRSTRTNFSPIWGLSLSDGLGAACSRAAESVGAPTFAATDEAGTRHECWAITDQSVLDELTSLVGSTPVLIADGHHRYETACTYFGEATGELTAGAGAVLALVVELTERELAVQSIHRLVTGVELGALVAGLGQWFEISPGPDDPIALRDALHEAGALGLITPSGNSLLVPTAALLEAADDDLDSSRLATALESVPGAEVTYQHGALNVAAAVREGRAAAAVLPRPVSVEQIARTAHGGKRMPPKSTFFYPKPRTGIVFRELDAG